MDRGTWQATVHGVAKVEHSLATKPNQQCANILYTQLCPTLCDPIDHSPPGSSVHGDSLGKNTGVDSHALLWGIFPTQEIEPRSPTLQVDALLSEL